MERLSRIKLRESVSLDREEKVYFHEDKTEIILEHGNRVKFISKRSGEMNWTPMDNVVSFYIIEEGRPNEKTKK